MSGNNRVVWSEGMFLRPQHFQQQARYIENFIEQRCAGLRSYPWGFTDLQLDHQLLGLGKIVITRAQGVFPDGTPFHVPVNDDAPMALQVPEGIHNREIFLCLPLRRPSAMEVEYEMEPDSLSRYQVAEYKVRDNTTMGGGEAEIEIGKLRLRLLLADEQRDEFTCLGVARIVEARVDKSIVLDEGYLPPALDCQALPGLRGFIAELHGMLNHRAESLAGRIGASGRGSVADISDFLLLQIINRYQPLLSHLATLPGYHPEELFRLLLAMAGELATFTGEKKRASEFPPYRHDDLQSSFVPLFTVLRQSLSMVLEQTATAIPLQQRRYGIRVAAISDRTLLSRAAFILAVAADLPGEELRKRLPLQIKIGPVEQIRQLVNMQLPGISVQPLPVAPRQIPYHAGFVYFELDRSGDLWKKLGKSGGIAFHLAGEYPGIQMELWAIKG